MFPPYIPPLESHQILYIKNHAPAYTKQWFLIKTSILRQAQGQGGLGGLEGLEGWGVQKHRKAMVFQRIKEPRRQSTTGPGGMCEAPYWFFFNCTSDLCVKIARGIFYFFRPGQFLHSLSKKAGNSKAAKNSHGFFSNSFWLLQLFGPLCVTVHFAS